MNKQVKIMITILIMLLLFASVTYAAGLEGRMNFTAESVYYEGNTLCVYGYWLNKTNKYIAYVELVNINIYSWNGKYWELFARGEIAERHSMNLSPGEMKYGTYRIHNSPIRSLPQWWVQAYGNFRWQNISNDV